MEIIFDTHLDLSMNAMEWNRDLRKPVAEIRENEAGMNDKPDRGKGMVAFPEMRRGKTGLAVATQIARYGKPGRSIAGWHSQEQAWAQTQGQLAWYRTMEEEGYLKQITSVNDLDRQVELWEGKSDDEELAIGYILSLEGADSLIHLNYLHAAYEYGLRAVGPAHYGPGVYAGGTESEEGFTKKGFELLKEMEGLGMILDLTHLSDKGFWEAMDHYKGPVWASHNNCRSLVPGQRQFSDDQIRALTQRGGIIGVAMDAWMLVPGWIFRRSDPRSMGVSLRVVADHMDHICQVAGTSLVAGIGSDLDGAFGREQCPYDLETIADVQKLRGILNSRGYDDDDIKNIMYRNGVTFLHRALK